MAMKIFSEFGETYLQFFKLVRISGDTAINGVDYVGIGSLNGNSVNW